MRIVFLIASLFLVFQKVHGDCDGQILLPRPENPALRGPWPVGVKTVFITSRNLTTEIWYPASLGSQIGQPKVVYSMRDEHLPPAQASKIPDEENPLQICDCYRDIPLDTKRGPYPVHLHIHGTAGFRQTSMHQMIHYASRGFVVVACDHPGITLYDMLILRPGGPTTDQTGDAYKIIEELKSLIDPQLEFLKGYIDMEKLAISGHSAGGSALNRMGDVAPVLMPWAAGGTTQQPLLKSTLVLAGEEDGYSRRITSYENSPSPKRFTGLARAGHVFCTDLCWIGEDQGGIVEIALRNDIYLAVLLAPLIGDSCDEGKVKNQEAWDITNYASAGVQEELLMCDSRMTAMLAKITENVPSVLDYFESL